MSRDSNKRKAAWHVHTGDEKRLAVEVSGGAERRRPGPHPSLPAPAPAPNANPGGVSKRSLRRYRREIREEGDVHEPLPRGHPQQKLSAGERRVVGGKVLWRWVKGKITDIEFVVAWIHEKFGEQASIAFVSQLLSSLHLVSKEVTEKPLKYYNPDMIHQLWDFLKDVHIRYRQGLRLNQLVAVDVCYWTNSAKVQQTIGPQGRCEIRFSFHS